MKKIINKIIATILVPAIAAAMVIGCSGDDNDGITYSMNDVSSRITGFSSDVTGAGATLIVNGTQLDKLQRVFIGDEVVPAHEFTSVSESTISFVVPSSVARGEAEVLFVWPGPDRGTKTIEIIDLPAIGDFYPTSVSAGETVTVTGNNLNIVTSVMLGDNNATIVSNTPTILVFTVPASFTTGPITLVSAAGGVNSANNLVNCATAGTSVDCVPGLNLNFGLEEGGGDDFANWGKWNGGTFMVATTVPGEYYRGGRALKVIRDGSLGDGQWRIQFVSDPVDTEIGVSYTVYVWARAAVAGAGFRVSLNPDSGFYPGDVAVTTAWQQFSFVVPGERITTEATRFVLDLNGTNTAVTTFYIDDVKVIKN